MVVLKLGIEDRDIGSLISEILEATNDNLVQQNYALWHWELMQRGRKIIGARAP